MAIDVKAWRRVVEQTVDGLADEAMQRRAWFGLGPEESSPDEEFCMFFGDAAIEEFLEREDTGLTANQLEAGHHLVTLMRKLSDGTPDHIKPADLIDDPRWQKVRQAAARFHKLLMAGDIAAK